MQPVAPVGNHEGKYALSYSAGHQQPVYDEGIQVVLAGSLMGSYPEVCLDPTLNESYQRQNYQERSGRPQPLTSWPITAAARLDAAIDGILSYVACVGLELRKTILIVANQ